MGEELSPRRKKERAAAKQREQKRWQKKTQELNQEPMKAMDWSKMYGDQAPSPNLVAIDGKLVVKPHWQTRTGKFGE